MTYKPPTEYVPVAGGVGHLFCVQHATASFTGFLCVTVNTIARAGLFHSIAMGRKCSVFLRNSFGLRRS